MPGPGAYEKPDANLKAVVTSKFGNGNRSNMELPTAKIVPGPGTHSPDAIKLKSSAPIFGFGSETRLNNTLEKTKHFPGPGNYKLTSIMGSEGPKSSLH